MKPIALAALAVVLALNGCSCNQHPDDPPGETPVDTEGLRYLTVTPGDVTLRAENGVPATQAFRVTGHFEDDSTRDYTSDAVFSLDDPRLGAFRGADFTSGVDVGGTTQVRAIVGTFSGEATLHLVIARTITDGAPGSGTVPSNPGNFFGGAPSAAHAPRLVYPNDGVMVPPNLGKLEFHFRKGHAANSLFELHFSNGLTDVRIHLRCYMPAGVPQPPGVNDGCIYTPSPQVWAWLSETNRGAEPLRVTMRATDDTGSGPVGSSAPLSVQIARSELKGAVYYWTTSGSTGIMRYDFAGPPDNVAELALGPDQTGGTCVGCHALSRNGKKVVAAAGGSGPARVLLYDLSTNAPVVPFDSTPKSAFHTWSPDGTQYAGVHTYLGAGDPRIHLFDGNTGQIVSSINGTGTQANPPTQPDWSPDGQKIVYVRPDDYGPSANQNVQNIWTASLRMVTRLEGGWSAPQVIVPHASGRNRYYPAVAPDSTFMAYNESTCPSGTTRSGACDSDTDPTAMLWTARLVPDAPRVALARANAPGVMDGGRTALTNSYPKWSPFEVRGSDGPSSRLTWLTFSSNRRYGLRPIPDGKNGAPNEGTLLWMTAVDPDRAAADEDGSHPAFALPFQDLGTSNHIAQWAQYAVVDGCVTENDGCGAGGATCCNGLSCSPVSTDPPLPCDIAGACVCRVISTCGLTGESCSANSPCCGALACNNADGSGACTGGNCLCQPTCGSIGQACGAGSACCNGLLCLDASGAGCSGDGCSCRIGID